MMTYLTRALALALVILAGPAIATDTVLTVTLNGTPSTARHFDLAGLEALGVEDVVTVTPWTEAETRFSGVRLRRLLELAPAPVTEIHVVALNDYTATIPAQEARDYAIILATRRNDQLMPVRDKGPLWIIYPLSQHPELDTTTTHQRMVWQISRIDLQY